MIEHRMVVEADLAGDFQRLRLRLDTLELDAVLGLHDLHALQFAEEVEMPPGAAELAVGHRLQADRLLLRHHVADRPVLDLAELGRTDLPFGTRDPRLLQGGRTQQAADLIGAIGRSARHAGSVPVDAFSTRLPRQIRSAHHGAARRITQVCNGAAPRNLSAFPRQSTQSPQIRGAALFRGRAAQLPSRTSTRSPRNPVLVRVSTSASSLASNSSAPTENTMSSLVTSLTTKRFHSKGRVGSMLAWARRASTRSTKSLPRQSPSSCAAASEKGEAAARRVESPRRGYTARRAARVCISASSGARGEPNVILPTSFVHS